MNKLKARVERFLTRTASLLIKTGVSPNTLTSLSLIVALIGYVLVVFFHSGVYLSLAIVVSGFLDAIDGVVARATSRASRRGAFLDSFIDRACEVIYALSFIELGFDPRLVLLFTGSSLLISYARARGESLGLGLAGVGLMERAERLIALALISLIYEYNSLIAIYMYIVATTLVVLTVAHRFIHIWLSLR